MTDLPAPTAHRLRRPSWRDPRLLLGLVLVLAATALGARVLAIADRSVPVYMAATELTAGDPVRTDDLEVVRVRLAGAEPGYLSAADPLPERAVARRTVGAGELVPLGALGNPSDVVAQPVAIPVLDQLPSGLVKGALVDVWVAEPDARRPGVFAEPRRVVESATVAEVEQSSGSFASSRGTTVQVLVGQESLAPVLGALANDAEVSLVLVPGGAG